MTPDQLEKHKKCITGSKVASILGLPDAYDSAYTLFARMKGIMPWPDGNDLMLAGLCAELAMAEFSRQKWGWDLIEGPKDGAFHSQYPFIFGLADRLRKTDGQIDSIVEFKNQDISQIGKWEDGIPEKFKAQCYLYSSIFGLPCQVVACFGGNQYERFELPRDEATEKYILDACCQFWSDLACDKWPDPDGSNSTEETVKTIYKTHSGDMISGSAETLNWAVSYNDASARESEAKKEKEQYGTLLKASIAGNLGIDFGTGKVTWKETKPKTPKFDTERFAADHPALFAQYSALSEPSRRLDVRV
jgi:predicted phage-related endonuclease